GEIDILEELRVDNSILNSENVLSDNEASDHDNPLFPRPPPEPPDAEFDFEPDAGEEISAVMNTIDELNKDDPGEEFDISTNDEDDDYFPFMFCKDSDFKGDSVTCKFKDEKTEFIKTNPIPVYNTPRRFKYMPSKLQDFGDGGAFSKIHYAQYPLDMEQKARGAISTRSKLQKDLIIKEKVRANQEKVRGNKNKGWKLRRSPSAVVVRLFYRLRKGRIMEMQGFVI
nr:SNW/SKI-interacting protein-like [Tanacetum cinerariifolium]